MAKDEWVQIERRVRVSCHWSLVGARESGKKRPKKEAEALEEHCCVAQQERLSLGIDICCCCSSSCYCLCFLVNRLFTLASQAASSSRWQSVKEAQS